MNTPKNDCEIYLLGSGDAGRVDLEAQVQQVFEKTHSAHIKFFHEYLMGVHSGETLRGVIGCSPGRGPFFLDVYLREMVLEDLLYQRTGFTYRREQLVEIGNLVSSSLGGGRVMVACMAIMLEAAGFEWCIYTATRQVRAVLGKVCDEMLVLQEAQGAALDETQRQLWGSYYDQAPQVCASYLPGFVRYVRHRDFIGDRDLERAAENLGRAWLLRSQKEQKA